MINVKIENGTLPDKEVQEYLKRMREEYPEIKDGLLTIKVDGEYVDCTLVESEVRFQRIRRITGYLVGTLDRFNNAKRHEVEDRVKHGIGAYDESKL